MATCQKNEIFWKKEAEKREAKKQKGPYIVALSDSEPRTGISNYRSKRLVPTLVERIFQSVVPEDPGDHRLDEVSWVLPATGARIVAAGDISDDAR